MRVIFNHFILVTTLCLVCATSTCAQQPVDKVEVITDINKLPSIAFDHVKIAYVSCGLWGGRVERLFDQGKFESYVAAKLNRRLSKTGVTFKSMRNDGTEEMADQWNSGSGDAVWITIHLEDLAKLRVCRTTVSANVYVGGFKPNQRLRANIFRSDIIVSGVNVPISDDFAVDSLIEAFAAKVERK